MINKSASLIGTLVFANGIRNSLFIGSNRNTGETIVWQKVAGRKSTRVTGRNITKLMTEIGDAFAAGEASWIDLNDAAYTAFLKVA